jgi:hypothetical protein
MSLSFTDQQLADISLEYIEYPTLRQNLVDSKVGIQQAVDDFFALDEQNKQFTDLYRGLVAQYNAELAQLGEDIYTLPPDEVTLDAGAKRSDNFFPLTPLWVNLPPKLIDANFGNPQTPTSSPTTENVLITRIQEEIDFLRNGKVATKTTQLSADFTIGDLLIEVDDSSIFTVGDEIQVLNPSGEGFFARIDVITETTAPAGELELTYLVTPTGNVLTGEDVTDGFIGFSNTVREGGGTPNLYETAFLAYRQTALDDEVNAYEVNLASSLSAVQAIDDLKNKTANLAYESSITTMQSALTTWEAEPLKYGDTALTPFETALSTRGSESSARVSQIGGFVGSLSQDGSGNLSGSGILFDFAQWQDKRINLASGSRSNYYGTLNGIVVADKNIEILDTNRAEQDIYFVIQALTFDGNGTNTVFVTDTTGFLLTDEVKVIAEGQAVLTGNVTALTATSLTLDVTVSTDYSLSNTARIVKQN